MIEVPIPDSWWLSAEWLADDMGELNNSIRKGEGNVYGFLGELIFVHLSGATHQNTYQWDAVLKDGSTADVKTKCVTSEPKPYYDCSVAAIGTNQDCDYYAFVRVHENKSVGWYLGAMLKQDFLDSARFLQAGVPDGDNGWSPTIDCYNVTISDLGYTDAVFPEGAHLG